ncbi:DUF5709 domain-containing protein [Jatrophihabitans cynanchi]|jgi:hypothetical protein|uniref:DUF5709 domain-containing protein n=1 Tax=Jatrophihabitans cynanchi TaxID=2944128 RepID=A0ABY7JV73_9ACTN|nr:DUF5709 domain-containing protein [Jatrophihabitans sp. SB3-54]WAX56454.1 DUF5709 domain-containing protein [Jatrophihabitans sp. SB3-54]
MSDDSGRFGDSGYESGDPDEQADVVDPIDGLLGGDPDEPMQTGYSSPDREPHNLRDGLTAAEEREGPSLDEQLAAEEPEVTGVDDEPDPRAGRLVAPDEGSGIDEEAEEVAEDVGPAGYASSAEEAAMHIREDPDGR